MGRPNIPALFAKFCLSYRFTSYSYCLPVSKLCIHFLNRVKMFLQIFNYYTRHRCHRRGYGGRSLPPLFNGPRILSSL